MSDNPERPIDFLVTSHTDDAAINKTLARLDEMKARIAEAKELAQSNIEASTPTFGENIAEGVEKATGALGKMRDQIADVAEGFSSGLESGVGSATNAIQSFGDKAEEIFTGFERAGERAFKTLTRFAVAIIGIGVGSAASFGKTYEGVDPQATAQVDAQNKVKEAFDDLGRVTSRLVIPALENIARGLELFAQSLDKTFPPGQENPVTYFFNHDIPEAAHALNDFIGLVKILGASMSVSLGTGLDAIATGLRVDVLEIGKGLTQAGDAIHNAIDDFTDLLKVVGLALQDGFGKIVNGLIGILVQLATSLKQEGLAKQLRAGYDTNAEPGDAGTTVYEDQADAILRGIQNRDRRGTDTSVYDTQIAAENAGLSERTNKAVGDFNNTIKQIADDTNTANDSLKALGDSIKATTDAALDAPRITKAEVDAFIQRNRAVEKAEQAFADGLKQIEDKRTADLARIDTERGKALTQLATDQAKGEQEILAKSAADRAKAQQDFADNELKIQQTDDLRRQQEEQRNQLTLDQLAAAGDVAGFVQEKNRQALQKQQQDQQDALEKSQRADQYTKRQAEIDTQQAAELQKLHETGEEKRKAIIQQSEDQRKAIEDNTRDQITALKKRHDEEMRQIDTDFAIQLGNLGSHLAGLNQVRDADYLYQSQQLQAFVGRQQGYLQQLYNSAMGMSPQASYMGQNPYQNASNPVQTFVTFAEGAIQNTVGDLLTQSAFGQALGTITQSIGDALGLTPSAPGQQLPTQHVGGAGA